MKQSGVRLSGGRLYIASSGIRTKWPSGRRIPLYQFMMRMKSLWIVFLILKTAFRSKHRLKSLNLTFYVIGEVSLFVSFGHERERGQIGQFQKPEYSWIWLLTFSTFDRSISSQLLKLKSKNQLNQYRQIFFLFYHLSDFWEMKIVFLWFSTSGQ